MTRFFYPFPFFIRWGALALFFFLFLARAQAQFNLGDPVVYSVIFNNPTGSSWSGVTVSSQYPTDFTYNSCSGAPCSNNSGTVSWNVGTVLSGQSVTLLYQATVSSCNTASGNEFAIISVAAPATIQDTNLVGYTVNCPTYTPTVIPTPTATIGCCAGGTGTVAFSDPYSSNTSLTHYGFYIGDNGAVDPNYANYFSASGGNFVNTANPTYASDQLVLTGANFSAAQSNYTVECDVMAKQIGGLFGIMGRAQDGANFYDFVCNNGQWQIERHTSAGWSYLATSFTPTYVAGTWVHLTLVCCGNNLLCYVNNQLVFNVTDSTFTSGEPGIRSGYMSSPNVNTFANYKVSVCVPTTSTPTPTNTPTITATLTTTNSPTWTASFTPTSTFTATKSPTITKTPTASQTPTQTSTWTLSPTLSPTKTITLSPTATLSPTVTSSFTVTSTPTLSPTLSPTKTATQTRTITLTPTDTFTATWTQTRTVTPTFTETLTRTSTNTPTLTLTPTDSFTPTFTPTVTLSPTVTATPTITLSPTETSTPGPDVFYISKNVVGPGTGPVSIFISYPNPGNYAMRIYNSAGEFINNLGPGTPSDGITHSYLWNGEGQSGQHCASGVYIIYYVEPERVREAKIILLR